jgi:hypothetical protein
VGAGWEAEEAGLTAAACLVGVGEGEGWGRQAPVSVVASRVIGPRIVRTSRPRNAAQRGAWLGARAALAALAAAEEAR